MTLPRTFLFCFVAILLTALPARAVETDCIVHDPSTIVKRGDTYWVFGTGTGCPAFSSRDRLHWKFQGQVFADAPKWVASTIPKNTRNSIWAPDVRLIGGKYYLYYSVSTFGSSVSAIGLATSATLAPGDWQDQGVVVRSAADSGFNTIDPCVVSDANGGLWLTFGSFWSGIRMIRLDPTTGKASANDSQVYLLAAHPQDRANSIEASCLYYRKGYYYLFVNWDYCCRGSKSTYNIRVGRSRAITGPYLDRSGQDMRTGGGTPFLSTSTPEKADAPDQVGPGHAGIFSDGDGDWFSCHYEWTRDHNGAPTLNIQRLTWDNDGWPNLAKASLTEVKRPSERLTIALQPTRRFMASRR